MQTVWVVKQWTGSDYEFVPNTNGVGILTFDSVDKTLEYARSIVSDTSGNSNKHKFIIQPFISENCWEYERITPVDAVELYNDNSWSGIQDNTNVIKMKAKLWSIETTFKDIIIINN